MTDDPWCIVTFTVPHRCRSNFYFVPIEKTFYGVNNYGENDDGEEHLNYVPRSPVSKYGWVYRVIFPGVGLHQFTPLTSFLVHFMNVFDTEQSRRLAIFELNECAALRRSLDMAIKLRLVFKLHGFTPDTFLADLKYNLHRFVHEFVFVCLCSHFYDY